MEIAKSMFSSRTVMWPCLAIAAGVLGCTPPAPDEAGPEAGEPAQAASTGEPGRNADGPNPLKNVYFGEQHMHSENSPDAFAIGVRQKREDAFRYGMGEEITLSTTGETFKKSTPYDFVALTDHAEYFGVMPRLIDPNDELSKTDLGKELSNPTVPVSDPQSAVNQILHSILTSTGMPEFIAPEMIKSNWQAAIDVMNQYNKPGEFTTLIAFEYTSIPDGQNMHRNVFFRDDVGPDIPFSSFDSILPEDLWTYQERQREAGHDNIAIPHNGNVSDGWMYSPNQISRWTDRRTLRPATATERAIDRNDPDQGCVRDASLTVSE